MLRRTVSQPLGLDRGEQLGRFNASLRDLTSFARSRSSLMLDNDYTADFFTQATRSQWDNEDDRFGWQPMGRCRGMGYEEPDHDDVKVSEDTVYVAEEEEVWNSSDLVGEKKVIVELLNSKKSLMKRNADLMKALDACEDTNTHLEMEDAALKREIKSMKQSIQDVELLMEEMDGMRAALTESETKNSNLKSSLINMEKENKALINQIETMANEMANMLPERESDKNKIRDLTQHIKALQQQLEKSRVELDIKTAEANREEELNNQLKASLEEMSTREQNLRAAVKNLEGQLEFARVTAGGSFLNSGDIVLPATPNQLSLAEELGLLPGLPELDESEEDEVNEAVKDGEEIVTSPVSILDDESEVDEVDEAEKVEEEIIVAVALEESGDAMDLATEESTKCLDEKNVLKLLDEENVNKNSQAESFDMEQKGACFVAELGQAPQCKRATWTEAAFHSFRRGLVVSGAFILGVVLPLSVVNTVMPQQQQHGRSGPGCADFLWSTFSQTVEQFCSVQLPDRPAF
ncbi:myosin heavy chain, non-muscle-like isoform X2 [Engraulis encrasicolus]|uniref:myosin heavy chain, non-muscle-like isoform X2 n=1 Tax=Engraulis encrasicolus TaxID=184585 RepID=UPI002FD3B8C8